MTDKPQFFFDNIVSLLLSIKILIFQVKIRFLESLNLSLGIYQFPNKDFSGDW